MKLSKKLSDSKGVGMLVLSYSATFTVLFAVMLVWSAWTGVGSVIIWMALLIAVANPLTAFPPKAFRGPESRDVLRIARAIIAWQLFVIAAFDFALRYLGGYGPRPGLGNFEILMVSGFLALFASMLLFYVFFGDDEADEVDSAQTQKEQS